MSIIPGNVTDEQALCAVDLLATGFWAARISYIKPDDTVLIIGAGPTGICTLLCVMLKKLRLIIVCGKSAECAAFVREHCPEVPVTEPEECARPDAVVTVVVLYDTPQVLPLQQMYGKNLMITHRFPLDRIGETYELFESHSDGVMKIAVESLGTVSVG